MQLQVSVSISVSIQLRFQCKWRSAPVDESCVHCPGSVVQCRLSCVSCAKLSFSVIYSVCFISVGVLFSVVQCPQVFVRFSFFVVHSSVSVARPVSRSSKSLAQIQKKGRNSESQENGIEMQRNTNGGATAEVGLRSREGICLDG